MSKTKRARKPSESRPQILDEETSARVIAEYLDLSDVTASDIAFIEEVGGPLSYRQIALTFRVSEVLEVSDAFAVAPRFADGFAFVRALFVQARKAREEVQP